MHLDGAELFSLPGRCELGGAAVEVVRVFGDAWTKDDGWWSRDDDKAEAKHFSWRQEGNASETDDSHPAEYDSESCRQMSFGIGLSGICLLVSSGERFESALGAVTVKNVGDCCFCCCSAD